MKVKILSDDSIGYSDDPENFSHTCLFWEAIVVNDEKLYFLYHGCPNFDAELINALYCQKCGSPPIEFIELTRNLFNDKNHKKK